MAWVKLDDAVMAHPKVMALGDAQAFTWWVGAIAYCNRFGTGGFVAGAAAVVVAAGLVPPTRVPRATAMLVETGLLDPVPGGWCIHDYDDYQPGEEEVRAKRARDAARQRRYRERRASRDRHTVTPSDTERDMSRDSARESHYPDPTRPDPTRPAQKDPTPQSASVPLTARARGDTHGDGDDVRDQDRRVRKALGVRAAPDWDPAGLQRLVAAYPRAEGVPATVAEALPWWDMHRPDPARQAELLAGVRAWAACPRWQRDGGRYVLSLARFLEEGRWKHPPTAVEAQSEAERLLAELDARRARG